VPKVLIGNQHVSLNGEDIKEAGYEDQNERLSNVFFVFAL
jgi:hypothetical protein